MKFDILEFPFYEIHAMNIKRNFSFNSDSFTDALILMIQFTNINELFYSKSGLIRTKIISNMSAKSVIQKLEDSELIRLFLEFVQHFRLQYEKMSKQISYKCYEATWVLINFKANGYGRTESEAYKHALRNLLQILIEEPAYTQFFVQALSNQNLNGRLSIKKQPVNDSNCNYAKKIISSKTQGHEPIEKETKLKGQPYPRLYESYSKINQRSQTKFGAKGWDNPSVKMIQSTTVYHTAHPQSQNSKNVKDKMPENVFYSKASLSVNDSSSSEELRKALKKLSELEEYLMNLNKQNETLKKQISQINESQSVDDKENIPFTSETEYCQKVQVLNEIDLSTFVKSKPAIPKLKLQILPNYHKKSEKSLNQSLMAAYNEKREQSVKKLVC